MSFLCILSLIIWKDVFDIFFLFIFVSIELFKYKVILKMKSTFNSRFFRAHHKRVVGVGKV